MKKYKYITQMTREDLRELAAVTNLVPGFCISISRHEDGVEIGIDKRALALAINGFIRNGGANTDAVGSTNVSFDPPG